MPQRRRPVGQVWSQRGGVWRPCGPYLVAGLRASGLHRGQAVVVSGDGVVVLDALLGAALFVDLHQRQRRRVVLHQPHLRRDRHHPGHWGGGEELTRVEEAEQLQHPFLSPRLRQAGVVHHQVRVDFAVVAADIETACGRVVFLNYLHSGHEPGDERRND
ncbi:hypothetical protein EYF80_040572 [Liparis tanakae]|uniref:Uncharacterized protein n=1 Tax=Liparis tanakae TaxID=230148 RepID=A0A4Z2G6L1_9TELE|nr:hypothetical protein EYF80_040572 [Liparis tanakae]